MIEWVDVEEWTPVSFICVLVYVKSVLTEGGDFFVAFIDDDQNWRTEGDNENSSFDSYNLKNVTHWTLLPKEPK